MKLDKNIHFKLAAVALAIAVWQTDTRRFTSSYKLYF